MTQSRRTLSFFRTVGSTVVRASGEAILKKFGLGTGEEQVSKAAERLVKGLDELKGAAMKFGQMLSLDNSLLPLDWQKALSLLQNEATPRDFEVMKEVLIGRLGTLEAFDTIEPVACAAASMSQVHKAWLRGSMMPVAVKIRYPDLAQNVDSDLKGLHSAFRLAGLAGREIEMQDIMQRVKELFEQELDFTKEKEQLYIFKGYLEKFGHGDFEIAAPIEELCGEDVLVSAWLSGLNMDVWLKDTKRSQLERDALGTKLVRLTLFEIFKFHHIQSDPNPANFLVRPDGVLGLVDFGATVGLPEHLIRPYLSLFRASLSDNKKEAIRNAIEVGYLKETDSKDIQNAFVQLMGLVCEPFKASIFDWNGADYGRRVKSESFKFAAMTRLRSPPADLLFLNRRIVGTEMFLERLQPKVKARDLFEEVTQDL